MSRITHFPPSLVLVLGYESTEVKNLAEFEAEVPILIKYVTHSSQNIF